MIKKCIICQLDFHPRRKDSKVCDNPACKQQRIRNEAKKSYETNLKPRCCTVCNSTFQGRKTDKRCSNCKSVKISQIYETTTQDILCMYCGTYVKTIELKLTPRTLPTGSTGRCRECIANNRKKLSISKKLDNPNSNIKFESIEEYEIHQQQTRLEAEEAKRIRREELISRMRTSNPMSSETTKAKVQATREAKKEAGTLVFKSGPAHHLYKGKRNINKTIRIKLRSWFKETKQNYTHCSLCQAESKLHTHHTIPLQKIIDDLNYDNLSGKVKDMDQQLLASLVNRVLQFHEKNPDIAQVVCEHCHAKIDPRYRRLKLNNEN